MIDVMTLQLSFLVFEAIFCFLCALVYSASKDTLPIRKIVVLALNISCGFMLICEFLFYVYYGSTDPVGILLMYVVNAAVYYLIVLLLLFYTMMVFLRLFGRVDLKPDMPCRKRFIAILTVIVTELVLVTISQFTGIFYYFDENNIYQRGPFFLLSAIIPTIGLILVTTVILQYRKRMSLSQLLVLLSYLILPLAGEIFQVLFFGSSIMNICMGLSVLLMFFENVVYKEKEIVKASKTEVRTGLANELGCIEWLNSMKGNDKLKEYTAVFFDLRKFSDINRVYGIENGNRILANFGNKMLKMIENDEILGRQFGNQFVAIVKDHNLEKLLDVLKEAEVPFIDCETGRENKVTLSARIGVYKIDRTDLDGEDILVFAAQALVAAKSRDNDDIVWLTQELLDSVSERKKLESDIKTALKSGEFQPYYQPKVNIITGRLCGIEALSRWIRGNNIVSPGVFIPIMEANDTIRLLDLYMLERVCGDIEEWLKEGINVPAVSINFSRRNLADPDLAGKIDKVVRSSGIPKDLIEIEVTETDDEFSIDVLRKFVEELHSIGYTVSIDDFGSASSSLTLLREILFDTLKIDKGFVDNSKSRDLTILSHIIKLAKEIDIDIIAEGVEQKNQIDTLNKLGVEVIQGFYYDRPLSKEDMTKRLRSPEYAK
ncbi:MAG: GGDEF domain-containing phosphodiesterase [Saccharofermentans sp.]|nr:GGDEF domain-containing phosphodiesterase [Saccharofermentans sp.]